MSTVEKLERAKHVSQRNLYSVSSERQEKLFPLREVAHRHINLWLDAEYGKRISELTAAYKQAEDAYNSAVEAKALAGAGAPHPIGTKLFLWKMKNGRMEIVKRGVLEAITRESIHPENLKYSKASLGSYVIRMTDKKGKPMASYIGFRAYNGSNGWKIEGDDPNTYTCVCGHKKHGKRCDAPCSYGYICKCTEYRAIGVKA